MNGVLVLTMGDPDPENYRPETGIRTVTIEAGGNIEILLAVSDYSHLYSGMVYPAAFGEPRAVSALLNARLFFRTALCAAALTVGLLAVMIGFAGRNKTPIMLYGLLCLLFIGYAGYPITQTFFSGFQLKYAIENVSFCAMLCVVMLLARRVCGIKKAYSGSFLAFGGLMCLFAASSSFLWQTGSLRIMMAYSTLVSVFEWSTAGFLTLSAVWGVWNNSVNTRPLLYGILVFDTALIADRLLPLFEPIATGWFIELASFIMIAALGITVGQEVAAQYRNAAILTERTGHMERLFEM